MSGLTSCISVSASSWWPWGALFTRTTILSEFIVYIWAIRCPGRGCGFSRIIGLFVAEGSDIPDILNSQHTMLCYPKDLTWSWPGKHGPHVPGGPRSLGIDPKMLVEWSIPFHFPTSNPLSKDYRWHWGDKKGLLKILVPVTLTFSIISTY